MLEIRDLHGGYGGEEILRGLSMDVPRGQITAVVGPNGCGKSTLLKTLCGILPPSGGSALLEGEDLLALRGRELARKVACLPQERRLPEITVERLVLHGRFPHLGYPRRYRAADRAAARAAMERMGLTDMAEQPLTKLSGGQRQRAYIAMALAQDTPVIAMDEPTTYLDICRQLQLMEEVRALCAGGKTVLMVLHDLPRAMAAADHIAVMAEGRVMAEGTPEEVYASGAIDAVFGIRLRRMAGEDGWQYYCVKAPHGGA